MLIEGDGDDSSVMYSGLIHIHASKAASAVTLAVAPQIFFRFLFGALRMLFIRISFNSNPTIRTAAGLVVFAKAVEHGVTRIIFADRQIQEFRFVRPRCWLATGQ